MADESRHPCAKCPKCGSLELKTLSERENPARDGSMLVTTVFECTSCEAVFVEAR